MSNLNLHYVNTKIEICQIKLKINKLKELLKELQESPTQSDNSAYSQIDLTNELIDLNNEILNTPRIIKYKIEITNDNLIFYQCQFLINDFLFYLAFKTKNTNGTSLDPFKPLNSITEASFDCDSMEMKNDLIALQSYFKEHKNIPLLKSALEDYTKKYKVRQKMLDQIGKDDDFEVTYQDNGYLIKILTDDLLEVHWSYELNKSNQTFDCNYEIKINNLEFANKFQEDFIGLCSTIEMDAKVIENSWKNLIPKIKSYLS